MEAVQHENREIHQTRECGWLRVNYLQSEAKRNDHRSAMLAQVRHQCP